jgi:hypothetical protein
MPQVQIAKTYKRVDPKVRGRSNEGGWRYSNWFITIQTNVKAKSDEHFFDFQDRFEKVLGELFQDDSMAENVISVNEKYAAPGEAWDEDWVDIPFTKAKFNIEEGTHKKGGRIHAHGLLEARHKGHFLVDRYKIKMFIDNHPLLPEVKGCKVWVTLVKDNMKTLLDYIRKDEPITSDEWKAAASQT